MTTKEKQQHGADHKNTMRTTENRKKIDQAIIDLIKQGKKATQREIAALTGFSLKTVSLHLTR